MPSGPGAYGHLVTGDAGEAQALYLGPEGGRLLLDNTAQNPNVAGAMTLTSLQNRVWHLLREPGPDTGFPVPTTGDYPVQVVTRDLNIALAQFISMTGIAPKISEKILDLPVYPGLDYPLPQDLQALIRIDYTIAGQTPYKLIPLNWEDFDRKLGDQIPGAVGNPYYYRESFAGYIRLQPQPTLANYIGPGLATISLSGTPTVGDQTTITVQNPTFTPITTAAYTTQSTDTLASIANSLASKLNQTSAVTGSSQFLQPASVTTNAGLASVVFSALTAPGTGITYYATTTSTHMTVVPTSAANLSPNGDIMTFYYQSTGDMLINPGDTPGIPPQFHMTLVYRVLMDYWRRKQDLQMAKEYERMYKDDVLAAKKLGDDAERETQHTIAGVDDSEIFGTPGVVF